MTPALRIALLLSVARSASLSAADSCGDGPPGACKTTAAPGTGEGADDAAALLQAYHAPPAAAVADFPEELWQIVRLAVRVVEVGAFLPERTVRAMGAPPLAALATTTPSPDVDLCNSNASSAVEACKIWLGAGLPCETTSWASQCPNQNAPNGMEPNKTLLELCPSQCATRPPIIVQLPLEEVTEGATEAHLYSYVLVPQCVTPGTTVGTVLIQLPYRLHFQETLIPTMFSMVDMLCMALVVTINQGVHPSTGRFDFLRRAAVNGGLVVAEIKKQPWSNGVVMQFAPSGMCITSTVSDDIVDTFAQALQIGSNELRNPVSFRGGAFNNGVMTYGGVTGQGTSILSMTEQTKESLAAQLLPNEGPTQWWDSNSFQQWSHVTWPTVQIQGWFDIFNPNSFQVWRGLRDESNWAVKRLHRMVIETQGHCRNASTIQQIPIDAEAEGLVLKIGMVESAMLLGAFKDSNDVLGLRYVASRTLYAGLCRIFPPMVFYVMGTGGNYVSYGDDFPQASGMKLHLKDMNLRDESAAGKHSYVYDPSDLVPTIGGFLFSGAPCGSGDSSSLGSREDVLQFTGPSLTETLAIMGQPKARLVVESNVTDTDFIVKLVEVTPEGRRWLVATGVQRMRWRNGTSTPVAIAPGPNYVEVEMTSISWIFARGSKIGIEIQSSDYPSILPNPNTGLHSLDLHPERVENATALNTVDADASYVTLPQVEVASLPRYQPNALAERVLAMMPR